jgi:uncharacterized Zn finger protein (UPF0148 family)
MALCPRCNAPILDGASFCTSCGFRLPPIADPNDVAAASQATEEAKVASRERVRHRAEARNIRFRDLSDSIDNKLGGSPQALFTPSSSGSSTASGVPAAQRTAQGTTQETAQGTAPRMDVTPHSLELVRSLGRSIRLDCDGVFVRCRTYRYGSCRTCISVPIRAISSVGIARRFRVWLFILGLVMVAGAVLCFSEGIDSAGGLVLLGILLLFLAVGTICSAFIKMLEIRYDGTAISIGTWGATLSEMQPFIDDLNKQVAQDELMCRYGGVMPRR